MITFAVEQVTLCNSGKATLILLPSVTLQSLYAKLRCLGRSHQEVDRLLLAPLGVIPLVKRSFPDELLQILHRYVSCSVLGVVHVVVLVESTNDTEPGVLVTDPTDPPAVALEQRSGSCEHGSQVRRCYLVHSIAVS